MVNEIAIATVQMRGNCEYCGRQDNLLPVGKGRAKICWECLKEPKNENDIADELAKLLFPDPSPHKL